MKITTAIFFLLQLLNLSCNGQSAKSTDTTYVQQLEYGLNGSVKEVTTYTCSIENGKIPTDTTHYIAKRTTTFDKEGNVLEVQRVWKPGHTGNGPIKKTNFTMTFSGKGKEVSFECRYILEDGEVEKYGGKYVWSDDYNYRIAESEGRSYSNHITLDKNFRVIKTAFKKNDTIQSSEDLKYSYKNDKLYERINTITENGNNGEKKLTYQVKVSQSYDKYGNPTVTYEYSDLEKQHLTEVHFTEYEYYGK